MGNKYRKITISVSNDELNALEDYLVVDYEGNKEREQKDIDKSLRIWSRLVKEWDKPNINKIMEKSKESNKTVVGKLTRLIKRQNNLIIKLAEITNEIRKFNKLNNKK